MTQKKKKKRKDLMHHHCVAVSEGVCGQGPGFPSLPFLFTIHVPLCHGLLVRPKCLLGIWEHKDKVYLF
jgi:hypothetical protein